MSHPRMNKWEDHPLFMKELPRNWEQNEYLVCLQDMVYDGEPDEVAERFKVDGNDHLALKTDQGARDAIQIYTNAISLDLTDKQLEIALYNNRAQAHLTIKNWGHCLEDCKQVMKRDLSNMKALYRSAKALLGLERLEDAEEMILILEGESIDTKELRAILDRKRAVIVKVEEQRAMNKSSNSLAANRGIVVGKPEIDLPVATEIKEEGEYLVFPVIILYDEAMQSDFIGEMHEVNSLNMQLDTMLPPPWNTNYTLDSIKIFILTDSTNPKEVDGDTPLIDILLSPGYVMPRFPVFHVIHVDYVQEFLASY